MPRKRHIDPGFFTNDELFEAEKLEQLPLRVAYAGLWCCADRRGRFEWKPRRLKTDILPYDDVDFEAVLVALKHHGFIRCYCIGGQLYGDIPTFLEHQHPHPKEVDSVIPPYNDAGEGFADACAKHDAGISHVPPGEPVGVSEYRSIGVSEKSEDGSRADVREKLPQEYREDFDAMARSCHRPESFRLEVATLVAGKHPRAERATPEDVGRGIRELALDGRPHTSLAGFVATAMRRRVEKARDEQAKTHVKAHETRKREERTHTVSGTPTKLDLTGTLAKLGIVPDKGAA